MLGFDPATVATNSGQRRSSNQECTDLNRRILASLIGAAIGRGYTLTVDTGEQETVTRSTDPDAIFAGLFTMKEEYLLFYEDGDRYVGSLTLLHHGSAGVMADSSDNEELNHLADMAVNSIAAA